MLRICDRLVEIISDIKRKEQKLTNGAFEQFKGPIVSLCRCLHRSHRCCHT